MVKIMTKYRKYIITIIIMLTLSILYINMIYLLPKKYEELPEIKLKKVKNNKSFAIMVQNSNGYEEYKSNDNAWPKNEYEFKEAKCVDNNGEIVEEAITFANGEATLKIDKTVYCTLYFDKSLLGELREKDSQNNISPNLQGGMYRYQGTDNVANWICFGISENCGTNDDLIDKYMYRIIGITEEGEMYLIKETFLKEESNTTFTWNDKYSLDSSSTNYCDNGKCPDWPQSLLFKRINGISNGKTSGTGTVNNKADTDIFVDNEYYHYLKSGDNVNGTSTPSDWYNLIVNHEWLYGETNERDVLEKYNGNAIYAVEHGEKETTRNVGTKGNITQDTYTWNQSVGAKISLMYIHDYYYTYYDGSSEESRGNAGSYDKLKNSWIVYQNDGYNMSSTAEWLSTRLGIADVNTPNVYAFWLRAWGGYSNGNLNNLDGVRPVFYISSKVKIAKGHGIKENPFILEF